MDVVGIDLGTSNTVATVNGRVLVYGDQGTGSALPSVVAFIPSGATMVGAAAKRRRAMDPRNTIYSAKRIIGSDWHSSRVKQFQRRYPFELVSGPSGSPAFRTRAGVFSATDIGTIVLKRVAEAMEGRGAAAVIAVPTGFEATSREATRQAAINAGFARVETIDEPSATAWAYVGHERHRVDLVAVYDFGGGTFDVAILDCTQSPPRVLSASGDPYLGGDDVDRAIALWAYRRALEEHRLDLRSDPIVFDKLIMECERAKRMISQAPRVRIKLGQVDDSGMADGLYLTLEREHLASICLDLVRRTFVVCDEAMRQAGVGVRDIKRVVLAGGTTLLPHVRDAVAQYFGTQGETDIDPIEVVSVGAARYAATVFPAR